MEIKKNESKIRGVLNLVEGSDAYCLQRFYPASDLRYYVEQYWHVTWDHKDGGSYLQENLPDPSVHLVFERDCSRIVGPVTGRFSRLLEGQGEIFAVKFRPGGFYPFVKRSISKLADREIPIGEIFHIKGLELSSNVLGLGDTEEKIGAVADFLENEIVAEDEKDENVETISSLIELIKSERSLLSVRELCQKTNLEKRTLQRMFSKYVGLAPKKLIKKFRLHEVLEKMERGESDWREIVYDLGYCDQAHFIREFKSFVGKSPKSYLKGMKF